MPATRHEAFSIAGYADHVTDGTATVLSFDSRERWSRALQGLGLSWLVAAGTAFIPVGHFLLVPGFFLFGIYVFTARLRTGEITVGMRGMCPDCGSDQAFDPGGTWILPRTLTCGECGRALRATAP